MWEHAPWPHNYNIFILHTCSSTITIDTIIATKLRSSAPYAELIGISVAGLGKGPGGYNIIPSLYDISAWDTIEKIDVLT